MKEYICPVCNKKFNKKQAQISGYMCPLCTSKSITVELIKNE